MTPEFAATLAGKTADEVTAILQEKGIHVARRVLGQMSYPVYYEAEGRPAFNTGRTVPKALLDVQDEVVVRIEFFPAIPT